MSNPPAWAYLAYGLFFLTAFLVVTGIVIFSDRRR